MTDLTGSTIRISGGSGYGCQGWTAGQVVRSRAHDRDPQEPEWLVVVRSSRHYYREDGLSFGAGEDCGYAYVAECRVATADEAAPSIAARAIADARGAAVVRLAEVARTVEQTGERPAGEHVPEGEEIAHTDAAHRLYGGGTWWVVGTEWIWWVRNHGADGDDWARNNVRTGGAGAIGWRVPATPEMAAEIRALTAARA